MDEYLSRCRHIHDVGDDIFKANLHVAADVIDKKGQMEEFMFLGLRMNEGVTREAFERAFGISIDANLQGYDRQPEKTGAARGKGRAYLFISERKEVANYFIAQFEGLRRTNYDMTFKLQVFEDRLPAFIPDREK